ncbi:hypothetical protein FSP39_001099 [Pinctada imbricata]|uniref:Uncharacterized protein n=1 Tax=Pinctada imbricata TaxID=66713 RepID=A0AA89C890_PINIB|nr:hypothetical protein FSP39_001099 [Pinctada imbricata]
MDIEGSKNGQGVIAAEITSEGDHTDQNDQSTEIHELLTETNIEQQKSSMSFDDSQTNLEKKRSRENDGNDIENESACSSKRQKTGVARIQSSEEITNLKDIMYDLALEVKSLHERVFDRIDKLEKVFARNVAENMKKMVDKKIESEIGKVKENINSEVSTVNKRIDGLVHKIGDLKNELSSVRTELSTNVTYAEAVANHMEKEEKIVIKMLREREGETNNPDITKGCVEAVIRDGLRLHDVKVVEADRKKGDRNPGVVLATIETKEQKDKILKNKSKLKHSSAYSRVYIEDETPKEVRTQEANLRTILKEIGCDREYSVKNGRIQKKGDIRNRNSNTSDQNTENRENNYNRDGWRQVPENRQAFRRRGNGRGRGGRR